MGFTIRQGLTRIGELTSRPIAFWVFGAYVLLWVVLDRESLSWHSVATLVTWLMTLFIQRAEHRDTQALQAKLDELLRVHHRAKNEFTTIDQMQPEEIERRRAEERAHGTE
jgi:low affinity Fe/Cu permease